MEVANTAEPSSDDRIIYANSIFSFPNVTWIRVVVTFDLLWRIFSRNRHKEGGRCGYPLRKIWPSVGTRQQAEVQNNFEKLQNIFQRADENIVTCTDQCSMHLLKKFHKLMATFQGFFQFHDRAQNILNFYSFFGFQFSKWLIQLGKVFDV